MIVNTGGFAALLAPGLWRVLFNEVDMQPNQWIGVFNVNSSTRAYEDDTKVAGLGSMVSKPEGVAVEFDVPIMGSGVRYTHSSYGLGFRITREMWDDDLYSIMNKMSAELGRASSYKIEVDAWSILNNAFSSSFTGADGLALCHTAHTRLDGGTTIANRPSTDVDFSYTAYQAALDHYKELVDERGRPIVLNPSLLIIDTAFEWAAKEIMQSEYKPYTANNEINPLRGDGMPDYMTCRYLTDRDSWFLLSNKHDLNFWWRVRPETAEADDFLTGDALFKIYARYSKGFTEWRGVYGSTGA
jgi:phage major head subunit gpT-like protein